MDTINVMELIVKPKVWRLHPRCCAAPSLFLQEVLAFVPTLTLGDALDVMGHYEIFSAPVITKEGAPRCMAKSNAAFFA